MSESRSLLDGGCPIQSKQVRLLNGGKGGAHLRNPLTRISSGVPISWKVATSTRMIPVIVSRVIFYLFIFKFFFLKKKSFTFKYKPIIPRAPGKSTYNSVYAWTLTPSGFAMGSANTVPPFITGGKDDATFGMIKLPSNQRYVRVSSLPWRLN